jgi:hypothetical protein
MRLLIAGFRLMHRAAETKAIGRTLRVLAAHRCRHIGARMQRLRHMKSFDFPLDYALYQGWTWERRKSPPGAQIEPPVRYHPGAPE